MPSRVHCPRRRWYMIICWASCSTRRIWMRCKTIRPAVAIATRTSISSVTVFRTEDHGRKSPHMADDGDQNRNDIARSVLGGLGLICRAFGLASNVDGADGEED